MADLYLKRLESERKTLWATCRLKGLPKGTRQPMRVSSLAALALALAACGSPGEPANESTSRESAESPAAPTNAASANAAAPRTTAAGALAAYVGKYPTDPVDGVSWNDNPLVRAAVAASVTDPAVRKVMLANAGPAAPIELIDGKVAAWACERHNCGAHQWTVLAAPSGASAQVCYFKEEAEPAASRWFLPGGTHETRPGNCQLGQD